MKLDFIYKKSTSDRVESGHLTSLSIIINLAVGGDWGGKEGIDTLSFPQSLKLIM